MENSALSNIMTRTSVRKFTNQKVEKENVEAILRAAMSAPSAVNAQPWDFVVVTNETTLQQLAAALPFGKMLRSAPLAIVVCGNLNKALKGTGSQFWIQDCSNASENILLAAHALGLGSVWTAAYPDTPRVASVGQILALPEEVTPLNVIAIGYPAEMPKPKNKWKDANVHFERW